MKKIVLIVLLALFTNLEAQNLLKFLSRNSQQWINGDMKDITLVVAPQGNFVENSLYINYRQSGNFSQWQVHHTFELPPDAVVNDMWLWVGNQVVKARVIDSWKASTIFDSVVAIIIDPALLTKKGNFYELRIFPINSNQTRRIKITYTTPLKSYVDKYGVELPLKLMKSGTATTMPLHVLFRNNVGFSYENPRFLEASQVGFTDRADTLGFNYKYAYFQNIKSYQNLNLVFDHDLEAGYYFESGRDTTGKGFFSVAVEPLTLLSQDTVNNQRRILFAFDLSGAQFKYNHLNFKNALKNYVKNSTRHGDYLNILFRGETDSVLLSDTFFLRSDLTIDNLMNDFLSSQDFENILSSQKYNILFADPTIKNYHALHLLPLYGNANYTDNIKNASDVFNDFDIVISSTHNNYLSANPSQKEEILSKITQFIENGGVFIVQSADDSQYDHIVSTLIYSFYKLGKVNNNTTLYKKESPNGLKLQDEFLAPPHYKVTYSDNSVEIDLVRADQSPVQITKRLGNGYLVFNGIDVRSAWNGFNTVHYPGFCSYNVSKAPSKLRETLRDIKTFYDNDEINTAILISNSDVPFSRIDAINLASQYTNEYGISKPIFYSINLLEYYNTAFVPYINEPEMRYHGSGILNGKIAINMNGKHFERVSSSIDDITSEISGSTVSPIEFARVNVKLNNGLVLPEEEYFLTRGGGSSTGDPFVKMVKYGSADSVEVIIEVKLRENPDLQIKKYKHRLSQFPLIYNQTIPMMLVNEKIKELSSAPPFDTINVVNMAIEANILFRFSALICLEPNDTIRPLINPWDESSLTDLIEDLVNADTVFTFDVYPNPFNAQTKISFNLTEFSNIKLEVFDITGRLITTLTEGEYSAGRQTFSWNTVNQRNEALSSGIYFVRLITHGLNSGIHNVHYKKLMYLK